MTATARRPKPHKKDATPTPMNTPSSQTNIALAPGPRLPAERHPAAVYLASLAAGSLPAQRSALRQIAEMFGRDVESMNWGALRYQHVQFIRARLSETYAPSTANRLLTALRRVLREAWRLDYMTEADYSKLADVKRIAGAGDETDEGLNGRELSIGELTAVMAACTSDETLSGARDAAVIGLGYGLGLRRAEVAKAKLADYDRGRGLFSVKHGKGHKTRILPIDNGARDALEAWLKARGNEGGNIFYGVNKGGKISTKRVNARAIHELYLKRAAQANVHNTGFHDLRRSFVTHMLGLSVDVAMVAKLAGHASTATTLRYDKRNMAKRREAIAVLHVPYKRRQEDGQ